MTRKIYFFTVMTALFLLAAPNLRAAQSGKCGDNITWTLDDQGVLTIEGTGAMNDYSDSPWTNLTLTKAVIKDGVTGIGAYAFYECRGLTSVTIPASVTSIVEGAFANCVGLEKIESLAENPPTCGDFVFYGVDKNKCVLTVPGKSINAYKAAEGWKDFLQIIAGIRGVAQDNNAGVSARNGEITVTGAADNAVVEVYSTSGALVYRGTSKTVSVPSAGIYIVKAAGRTFKVKTAR